MTKKSTSILAKLALLLATVIWGSTFFIMEGTIENIGIFTLLAARFLIAGVLLCAILFKYLKVIDKSYILQGAVMGALVVSAYIAQTFGLSDPATTPGKNAFLTAVYCILVPFIFWGVSKVRPSLYNILAAVLCIFGITLVSMSGGDFNSICRGDALTLLGGLFYALHMVSVSIFSKNKNILVLTMLQFVFAGIIALVPALLFESLPGTLAPRDILSVLYLAVFATCICYILQNTGQKFTPPATASLILSLEAVFGVIFSVIFTSETVTPRLFAGFALIFLAIVISEVQPALPFTGKKKS